MRLYATTCEGKHGFKTHAEAESVIKEMNSPRRAHNRKLSKHAPAYAYKCPYCSLWHITGRKRTKIKVKEL